MPQFIQLTRNTVLKLKVRSGTDAERRAAVLSEGELGYTTDSKRVFVGDGFTTGGNIVASKLHSDILDVASGLGSNLVLNGDLFATTISDGFGGELNGLYIKNDSENARYVGPDFNPSHFEAVDGKVSIKPTASSLTLQAGFIFPALNNLALDGALWNIDSNSGKISLGFGVSTGEDYGVTAQSLDGKTTKAGYSYYRSSSNHGLFGGEFGHLVIKNNGATPDARTIELIGNTASLRFAISGSVKTGDDSYMGTTYNLFGVTGMANVRSMYAGGVRTTNILDSLDYDSVGNSAIYAFNGIYNKALPEKYQINSSALFSGYVKANSLVVTDRATTLNNILPVAGDGVLTRTGGVVSFQPAPIKEIVPGMMMIIPSSMPTPAGWLVADGTEYNRVTYPDLFAVLGTAYGSATPTTFSVPALAPPNIGFVYIIKA